MYSKPANTENILDHCFILLIIFPIAEIFFLKHNAKKGKISSSEKKKKKLNGETFLKIIMMQKIQNNNIIQKNLKRFLKTKSIKNF